PSPTPINPITLVMAGTGRLVSWVPFGCRESTHGVSPASEQLPPDPLCRLPLLLVGDVLVDVHRGPDRRVPHEVRDAAHFHAGRQGRRREAMAQIVDPDRPRDSGGLKGRLEMPRA